MVVANGVVLKRHIAKFLRAIQNQAVEIWHESRNLDFFEELCPHCLKPRYLRTPVIAIISSYIFSLPLLNKKRVILRESAVAFVRYHISSHSS